MASKLKLEFAGLTDVGRVREKNEDAIAISEEFQFAVLADGMGGYNGGEIASEMAVSGIKEILEKGLRRSCFPFFWRRNRSVRQILEYAISEVNQRIYQKARSDLHYHGMGTTLLVAVFHGNVVTIAHIGDSRIYRFRDGGLEQLTRDHTWVENQVRMGWMNKEEAQVSTNKNLLTRALGVYENVSADVQEMLILPGDTYLLCSDGLTDMLSEQALQFYLRFQGVDVQSMCQHFLTAANEEGGIDNISVILVQTRPK